MKRAAQLLRLLFISILCLMISSGVYAQNKRPKKQKRPAKTTASKQETNDNKAQLKQQLRDSRDRHLDIQDKKTLKRMKRTRKKSMIHAGKKKLPFYKRWFRRNRR